MSAIPEIKAVGILTEMLALECGYSPEKSRQIRIASVMHDCGKRFIPANIRDKPGKLTPQEFEIMKTHTTLGHEFLSSLYGELGQMARAIAMYHHEHFFGDGGYWGVPASTLPRYVGIVSLCDVLCSLLYRRVYKPAWPPEEALAYIQSKAGTQFCPELADIFIRMIRTKDCISAIFTEVSQ